MMRYVKRKARADDWLDYDPTMGMTIEVWDHEARFTGLLDADGGEIWCEPIPLGFHHPLEGR